MPETDRLHEWIISISSTFNTYILGIWKDFLQIHLLFTIKWICEDLKSLIGTNINLYHVWLTFYSVISSPIEWKISILCGNKY